MLMFCVPLLLNETRPYAPAPPGSGASATRGAVADGMNTAETASADARLVEHTYKSGLGMTEEQIEEFAAQASSNILLGRTGHTRRNCQSRLVPCVG